MLNDNNNPDDFLLVIDDDQPGAAKEAPDRVWRVLIVDDDDDIHVATRFSLKGKSILDRPVELVHAHSAKEAWEAMQRHDDIAAALIDVVMETPSAGLDLVRDLRDAGYAELRIILRTGQPGYAPELAVIADFEIDDYRTKSELTQIRLLTVLTAAIRAYNQICTIIRSRQGLEMIVDSAAQLHKRCSMEMFSSGVLTQISGLLRVDPHGVVCARNVRQAPPDTWTVVSAAGRYMESLGSLSSTIDDPEFRQLIDHATSEPGPVLQDGYLSLNFHAESGKELVTVLEADCDVSPPDLALLKLFSTNIAVGFENVGLVERLDRLAYIDPVLEVPNQNAFEARLQERLERGDTALRIALVHVDSYPFIVASYGLRLATRFLGVAYAALTRDRDSNALMVARVADGTFALLGDRDRIDSALIDDAFEAPHDIHGIEIASAATAVIIDLAESECDPGDIMRTASSALLHVSQTRRGEHVVYDEPMRAEVERRVTLQIALKQAVEDGQGFTVHLQPKVDLETGAVIAAEALLRWKHDGAMVSPAEFIPIAEAAGMMEKLTGFVLDTVAFWAAGSCGKTIPVAINLSMVDLNNPGFAERLLAQVETVGLSPATVAFEVTEGIAMQDSPWAIQQVQALKAAGYGIALDDFGTGYSSLGHFDRLPIDTLKIDRAFVSPLDMQNADSSLAAVMIGMARALKVDCVAEGIETREQEQALRHLGCGIGQGYLFGRPLPIQDFNDAYLKPKPAA